MIEVTSCSQESDCPNVVVWTKNGVVENSWGVWPDGKIENGMMCCNGLEAESVRPPSDDERAAILEAFHEWKVIGNWHEGITARPDLTRQGARDIARGKKPSGWV